jgi:hypothetical protein
MLFTIAFTIGFGSSAHLAGAYGTAVSTTMVLTTALLYTVMRVRWSGKRISLSHYVLDLAAAQAACQAQFLSAGRAGAKQHQQHETKVQLAARWVPTFENSAESSLAANRSPQILTSTATACFRLATPPSCEGSGAAGFSNYVEQPEYDHDRRNASNANGKIHKGPLRAFVAGVSGLVKRKAVEGERKSTVGLDQIPTRFVYRSRPLNGTLNITHSATVTPIPPGPMDNTNRRLDVLITPGHGAGSPCFQQTIHFMVPYRFFNRWNCLAEAKRHCPLNVPGIPIPCGAASRARGGHRSSTRPAVQDAPSSPLPLLRL